MYITKIRLLNFRNYEKLNLTDLKPGIVLVYGKNAQGKTNLLEALNLCANGKSFRVRSDTKTIRMDQNVGYAYAEYVRGGRPCTMEVLVNKDGQKSFKKNGLPVQTLKEMLGNLYVVLFSPEDIKTAKESPSLRRAFLDGEISKIRPSYVDTLKKYSSIIAQKNAALRKKNAKGTEDILRAFNEQLVDYIKTILKNRTAYVKKLNQYVRKTHDLISGGKEKIEIRYRATIRGQEIAEQLEELIPKEMADFNCSAGPHRDDIEFRINGKDVREYASQGQLRTMMLAVKIACLRILEDSVDHMPVLLLDDVFSELDEERKANLLKSIEGIQTFITTADSAEVEAIPDAQRVEVVGGVAVLEGAAAQEATTSAPPSSASAKSAYAKSTPSSAKP